jgi:hypothetical protein
MVSMIWFSARENARSRSHLERMARVCVFFLMAGSCVAGNLRTIDGVQPFSAEKPSAQAELPFELRDNLIVLKVRINASQPLSVALVTGIPQSMVSKERTEQLRLHKQGGSRKAKTTIGWDQRWLLRDVTFDLNGLKYAPPSVTSAGLPATDPPIDGALGGDLFERFVVEIDFTAKRVRLYEPRSYRYTGTGQVMPLFLRKGVPLVESGLPLPGAEPARGQFLINTGNPSTIRLYPKFIGSHQVLKAAQSVHGADAPSNTNQPPIRVGLLPQFAFGPYTLDNLHVMFSPPGPSAPAGTAGTIGTRILRCFNLVFDYPHHRLCLETNAAYAQIKTEGLRWNWSTSFLIFSDGEFSLNVCGARFVANQPPFTKFEVVRVRPGSAASQAGLREGDVLVTLNEQPVSTQSLAALMQTLGSDGKSCQMELVRGTERIVTTLKLNWLGLVESEQ